MKEDQTDRGEWPELAGEAARFVREHNWALTSLGPISAWPERLKAVVELVLGSPMVSSVALTEDRLLLYNDAAARLYGTSHPGVFGRPLREAFPESYSIVAGLYDRVFAGESITVHELPLAVETDGGDEVFDAYLTPVRGVDGAVIGVHMAGLEIGSRIRSEKALRASERRLQRVLETDAVAVLFFSRDGVLTDANDAFLHMTGYGREEIAAGQLTWQQMTPPEWHAISQGQMDQFLVDGRIGPYEKEYLRKDGSRAWMLFSGRDLGDGTIVELGVETTERKRVEAALRESEEQKVFLLKFSDALRPLADPVEIQGTAMRMLGEHLGVNRAMYFEIGSDRNLLTAGPAYLNGVAAMPSPLRLSDFSEALAAEYRRGNTFVAGDVISSPDYRSAADAFAAAEIRATTGVPLIKNGSLVAIMGVHQKTSRAWKPAEVALLEEVAQRTWAAVERARAEAALREIEHRLRTMADTAPVLIWEMDQTGVISVNGHYLEFFGSPLQAVLGMGWTTFMHPDDAPTYINAYLSAFRERRHFSLNCRFRRADGQDRWLQNIGQPVGDTRFVGCSLDITDGLRVDEALRESEERFRLFVENVREYAFVQTDFEGIITSWNPGAERLSGYSRAEAVGKAFALLLPEEDRHAGIIAREMAAISRGERNIDAHTMQRKDGSRFWAEWITEPVLDDGGKLRGTAKVIRDETERQQADLFVRNSLAEKEELLKEVHHRVKNNLQVITSMLNLQASSIKGEQALGVFQEMRNRVQSIASIHELLYRSASFAAIPLMTYAKELLSGLLQFYGAQSRVEGQVLGDQEISIELERAVPFGLVLNELISNALKHGFPDDAMGQLRVEIETDGLDTVLRVSNTGLGLPPGYEVGQSKTLGLRLVQILTRQLRGSFTYMEVPGTRFEVRFPKVYVVQP